MVRRLFPERTAELLQVVLFVSAPRRVDEKVEARELPAETLREDDDVRIAGLVATNRDAVPSGCGDGLGGFVDRT